MIAGIDDGHDVDHDLLVGIYNRIQVHPFQPGEDHTSIVFKLEQNISGNRPVRCLLKFKILIIIIRASTHEAIFTSNLLRGIPQDRFGST